MNNNMDLEMMIGYDEERKEYQCFRCGQRLGLRSFYKNKKAFLRHLKTKRHINYQVKYYPHVVPIFKEVLYSFTYEQLYNYTTMRSWVIEQVIMAHRLGKGKEKADYYKLTDDEFKKILNLKDLVGLYRKVHYKAYIIRKVLKYKQDLKNIIKESTVMCKDVMGIVAEYI